MRKKSRFSLDKLVVLLSVLYVIVPAVVFFFGWLKIILAIIVSIPFLVLVYFVYKELTKSEINLITKDTFIYWIVAIVVLGVWVYFSGIGAFSFQNGDHWVRNPIYRDICKYDWPVIFDLSKESAFVQSITGTGKVAFSYYFTFWLVPALISKILGLSELGSNIVLYIWSLLGVLLITYNINRMIKKCSYRNLMIFILFSGLDIIRFMIRNGHFSLLEHLEWWTFGYWIQYSSNTTQLYWVFNQSIPLWILMCLVLQLDDNKYIGSLCAMSFVYSPWATLGIIPIAWAGSFFKKQSVKQAFNPINSVVTILIALIYGVFYMSSSGSSGGIGTTFSFYRETLADFILEYFMFILLEFVLYYILVYKQNKDDKYFYIVLAELLVCPMIWMRDGNFTMRASMPALFILMMYVLNTFEKENDNRIKAALIVLLVIGSATPLSEINRSIYNTINSNYDNEEEIYSFGDMKTGNKDRITIAKDQFFIYNYEETPFFKYLGKK